MKTFLDRFAAILGASSVALLLISVVYEWGYFFQVGRHLQSILTPADYLSNAILWLPYTVPATLIWVRAARLNNVTPPLERRDWFNWKAWIKPAGSWAFVLAVLVTTPWPPAPVAMFGLVVCAVIIWSRFWGWFYWPIRGIDEELQSLYRQAVQIVPPFLAGVFVWGSISGSWDLERFTDPYLFKMKGKETGELKIFLQTFDRGVLLRNPTSNRVEFHKWDDVASFEKLNENRSDALSCRWFNVCMLQRSLTPSP